MNSDEVNWQDIRLFLAVAECGSFSGAARALKLGQPTLSRRIAALEEQLGQQLFIRVNQGCELTVLGAKLLPAAEQMAMWSTEALTRINAPNKVAGRVRVTAPPGIAFAFIAQAAAELKESIPDVQLEVLSDIITLNLARGEADISLRTEKPDDDDLICLASFYVEMKVYVSHELAEKIDGDDHIQNLNWICWPDDHDHLRANQILKQKIPNFKPVFTSNDYNVQLAACGAGLGALALPEGIEMNSFIKKLVPIETNLKDYVCGELHIVVHKRQRQINRVVKVSEFLEAYFDKIWPNSTKR
ncbi:MAG: LysR family transcriptional regulator [Paraglaciecola sp.]|nr:LysR family transcriptional regulator [Paraglaciecola sp.]